MLAYKFIIIIALLTLWKHDQSFGQSQNEKTRKQVVYYTYGMPSFLSGDQCLEECQAKYGFKEVPIAGCVVNNRIVVKAKIRAWRSDLIQFFRFGRGWYKDYEQDLKECRQDAKR
ncbi:hypothetical protein RCC89_20520 [Cytophagaceae bacterium ABcell3]|nr:hypothetical protein RCC89_20520 [Cytophagaceae bacterium ABcell3]